MRVYLALIRVALILTGLWMAVGVPAGAFATEPASESPQLVIAEPSTPANLLNYTEYYETADTKAPATKEAAPATEVNCGPACGSCSNACGCDPHWIVGVEAVWLSPQQQTGPVARYTIEESTGQRYTVVDDLRGPEVSGLFITPRISLGYQGDCWGIQTRYWRMNEPGGRLTPTDEDGLSSNTSCKFKAETVDLEVTRLFCWRETKNVFSFGFRYAELNEGTSLSVVDLPTGNSTPVLIGNAIAQHQFSGAGLTLGLTGYKPLTNRNFNLFYSVRGSMLWDDSSRNSIELSSYNVGNAIAIGNPAYGEVITNGDMFIGEIQVGTQWNFELVKNRADAFVRLALEYQYWATNDTGLASASMITPTSNGYRTTATASSGDACVDLIGFSVATGFTW